MKNLPSAYKNKLAVAFDLDGTLTPSKCPVTPEMAELFCRLIDRKDIKVAVLSGGKFLQFRTQFLEHLPCINGNLQELFSNLYLFPLDGSSFYVYKDSRWQEVYDEPLSPEEKEKIISALKLAEEKIVGRMRGKVYGEVIEDRGSQITFSALGQLAPLSEKIVWDPDHLKRTKVLNFVRPLLKEFDVKIGGTTTIDVNKKGVNKAYALRRMEEYSGIAIKDMLFVGDAIFKGGNDYQALETGVDSVKVKGPEDTARVISEVLGL